MPDHRGLVSGREFQRTRHIALAIDSGKDENGRFHFQTNLLPSPLPLRERVVRKCRWRHAEPDEGLSENELREPLTRLASLGTLSHRGEENSSSTLRPDNSRSPCWREACRRHPSMLLRLSPCRHPQARCRTPCPGGRWQRR